MSDSHAANFEALFTPGTVSPESELGRKAATAALHLLATGLATAAAFACSSVITAVVVGVICALVLNLLALIANIAVQFAVRDEKFESIGRGIGKVLGVFSFKSKA